ncbi:MAG: YicC/YloC family endoribonuclease [Burkholderiales bacterium]|nr:YicC/YloC family endoribonuclease [Burkholderiales bacterium]
MIHSMTGYATASRELAWGAVSVELRSVNHRYLDLSFRMPDELRPVEQAMREMISAAITRGKIECRVSYALRPGSQSSSELDATLLAQLLQLNAQVQAALPEARPLGVPDILRWPGMLGADTMPVDEFRATATELLGTALGEFSAARAREGAKLAAVILERAAGMRERIAVVKPRLPGIIAAFQDKLNARLKEAMLSADDERVRQEITLFINKIDVDEELSRLVTHLDELQRIVGKGGASGKRLDFLMQELNREANTLGSKSADVEVTRVAMDLKLLIEQMREQIQNIE